MPPQEKAHTRTYCSPFVHPNPSLFTQRTGSPYAGSPQAYSQSQTVHTTTYVPHVAHSSPQASYVSQPVVHSSPQATYTSTTVVHSPGGTVQGPTYEEEVRDFLDKTSPQRLREQSPTTLPPQDYMARAQHESVTNESSPARQRGAGSPSYQYSQAPVAAAYSSPLPVQQQYVSSPVPAAQSYVVASSPVPLTTTYVSAGHPVAAAASPYAGSPQGSYQREASPPPPTAGELHGESPRRIRAFGHPHVDPSMFRGNVVMKMKKNV